MSPMPPPPSNVHAEESILSAIIIDDSCLADALILSPSDFFDFKNQAIFSAMLALSKKEISIELTSLYMEMNSSGWLKKIGGAAHLANLVDHAPMAADVGYYARIVLDLSIRRQTIKIAEEIRTRATIETDVDGILGGAADLISGIADQRIHSSPRFTSFEQIFSMVVEEKPIAEGFFYEKDPLIIHAKGGVGKSMIALDIALKLASVSSFFYREDRSLWGKFHIPFERKTIFIQSENSIVSMHSRVRKMVAGTNEYQNGLKNIFSPSIRDDILFVGDGFSSEKFKRSVIDVVRMVENKHGKIDIMVIDPLISYVSGDENSNVDMRRSLDIIGDVCSKLDVTPILIHHDNKEGGVRGASAIPDWTRNLMGLEDEWKEIEVASELDNDGNVTATRRQPVRQIIFKHEKSNNFPLFPKFRLRPDRNLRFTEVGDRDSIPEKVSKRCLEVVQALKDIGEDEVKQKTLIQKYMDLSDASRATAQNHIREAVEYKFLTKKMDAEKSGYVLSVSE